MSIRFCGSVCLVLILMVGIVGLCSCQDKQAGVILRDDFGLGHLDPARWVATRLGDFQTEIVDVPDGRLRMAAATIGADDRTVKYHGVRSAEPLVDLATPVEISFDLDWNNQSNGCYMTAGMYLCPTATDNPEAEKSFLRVEYWGVWPGARARCIIATKIAGNLKFLLTEDWLDKGPGRHVTRLRLRVTLRGNQLAVTEDDKPIFDTTDLHLDFRRAYLYLQQSSHSNYPRREVFFDTVLVREFAVP